MGTNSFLSVGLLCGVENLSYSYRGVSVPQYWEGTKTTELSLSILLILCYVTIISPLRMPTFIPSEKLNGVGSS